ncbi:MAG TPA: acyl-CoA dehydrogenase family protein, partial [Actinomycetota bacterium]|nr:acyl-CoA dehydrogenase family protein [Actinomycetota bacterium]
RIQAPKEANLHLEPTDEQKAIAEALHDLAVNEIRPAARDAEATGEPPERIVKQLFEMGVAAPVPEEFGGQGVFDAMTSVLIAEELGWGDPGIAYSILWGGSAATLIDLTASQGVRSDLLGRIQEGGRATVLLAERDAAADIEQLDSVVEPTHDAQGVSGTKYGVVDADRAEVRIVVARSQGELGLWRLEEEPKTVKLEDKLGLRSARTFKVTLDRTGAEKLDGGEPGEVAKALLRLKLINAGISLGLARAALDYATDYAKERTAFGRPIGAFQAISFKIADRAMDLETARLMVWKAAWALDASTNEAGRFVMKACAHAVVAAVAAADDGVQILGGHGYMQDHPEEMWYRDALTLATFDSPGFVNDPHLGAVSPR